MVDLDPLFSKRTREGFERGKTVKPDTTGYLTKSMEWLCLGPRSWVCLIGDRGGLAEVY